MNQPMLLTNLWQQVWWEWWAGGEEWSLIMVSRAELSWYCWANWFSNGSVIYWELGQHYFKPSISCRPEHTISWLLANHSTPVHCPGKEDWNKKINLYRNKTLEEAVKAYVVHLFLPSLLSLNQQTYVCNSCPLLSSYIQVELKVEDMFLLGTEIFTP